MRFVARRMNQRGGDDANPTFAGDSNGLRFSQQIIEWQIRANRYAVMMEPGRK